MLPFLQSMVHHGGLDGVHATQTAYEFLKNYPGTLTEVHKRFVYNMSRGVHFPDAAVPDSSVHCLLVVPLLAARYAGKTALPAKTEEAVRVLQSGGEAVSCAKAAAVLLERVILGHSVEVCCNLSSARTLSGRMAYMHLCTGGVCLGHADWKPGTRAAAPAGPGACCAGRPAYRQYFTRVCFTKSLRLKAENA